MNKPLNTLTIAAAVTASLFASAALPTTVRKQGHPPAPSGSEIRTLNSESSNFTKGFQPMKYRSAKKGVSSDKIKRVSSKARLSSTRAENGNADIPQLNGILMYNKTWGPNTKPGLYSLPSKAQEDFQMIVPEAYGQGVIKDDRLYVMSHIYMPELELNYPRLTVYDTETKSEIYYENFDASDWSILPIDMAIDPTSGAIYGITYNSSFTGYQLSELRFTDKSVESTRIADLDPTMNWNSIAFDADGSLYAISKENTVEEDEWVCSNSSLNLMDKKTGAVTKIGDTGLLPEYPSSATIDLATGRMFWTVSPYSEDSYLAEVNLTTGAATILQNYGNSVEITSLYAPEVEAADDAPAKVKDLEVKFENGALTGTVSFTAPSTLYNSTPAAGALSYVILANDKKVAEGSTSFGAKVSENITLDAEGSYKFSVRVSNAAGESPAASTTVVVGNGVPYATPYVFLKYADGKMNLSWSPVNETVDGGFIDPLGVTYTVVRYPGEVVVAENTVDTSFSEEIAVPDSFMAYYYTVTTNFAGKSSAPSASNHVALGAIKPPYSETFDTEESLAGWTIIDVNKDRRMWMRSTWDNLRISFNDAMDMDDWAITPGIELKAGSAYQLSFDVYGDVISDDIETIEVKMGKSNTVEGMTTVVVAPTDVQAVMDAPLTVRATITPTESGVYFIGFHGISKADQYMLNLDNISIASALDAGAPAAPSDLTVTPDANGDLKVSLSFTTPNQSIAGGAIWQNLTKVEILRNGEVVKTLTGVAPNAKQTYTDTPATAGTYEYAVRCYNMFGQGLSAFASCYVGVNVPGAPENVTIGETVNEGEVTVSWSPVTVDIEGRPIPASKVSYMIATQTKDGWKPLYQDLTTTSHTFTATTRYQDMVQYAVFAKTEGGVGEGTLTQMIPVGPAYTSLHESFEGGSVSYLWGTQVIQNANFGIFDETSGFNPQDNDHGFLGMIGENVDDSAAFFSGKISLANMENPTLSFYTFNLAANNSNIIEVGVKVAGTDNYTTVKKFKISELCDPQQWGKAVISLKDFAGKTIQFQLKGVVKIYPYIFFDNIVVDNAAAKDLAITSIEAPEVVTTGTDYKVNVTVSNEGTEIASGYTVDLFVDAVKVDSAEGKPLSAGEAMVYTFNRQAHALNADAMEYSAAVVYTGDENPDNNNSAIIDVDVVASKLPVPENLKISSDGNGIQLAWDAPDLSTIEPVVVLNDIEEADSFAHSMKGWTFVDVDGEPVGGIDNTSGGTLNIPNLIGGITPASFFVFDSSLPQFGSALDAYSGDKYLAAMYRADDGQTDDWAISPLLTGEAQRISFVAKSLASDAELAEHIQVLYSTTGTQISDFKPVADFRTVPANWTKMTYNLPAGTKYFAIRSSSEGAFMLMIDDITYKPAVDIDEYKVIGYNVYRESERHNSGVVTERAYNDAEGESDHTYVVTAVYENKGESGASTAARLSAIESVMMRFSVSVVDGSIVINGTGDEEVTITALNGLSIHSGRGDVKVAAANGVYLVKVGKAVVKVLVK